MTYRLSGGTLNPTIIHSCSAHCTVWHRRMLSAGTRRQSATAIKHIHTRREILQPRWQWQVVCRCHYSGVEHVASSLIGFSGWLIIRTLGGCWWHVGFTDVLFFETPCINSHTHLCTVCPEKRHQNALLCNIFYKTRAIPVKFGVWFLE